MCGGGGERTGGGESEGSHVGDAMYRYVGGCTTGEKWDRRGVGICWGWWWWGVGC